MKLKRDKQKNFYIPTNSMSDVAFLLLIFIMLVALINYRKEVPIEFAEAVTVQRTTAEKNLEVWIDRNGNIYLNGDDSDLQSFQNKVDDLLRTAPATRIHIIADKNTPYERINVALEILQTINYRVVSFVVKDAQ